MTIDTGFLVNGRRVKPVDADADVEFALEQTMAGSPEWRVPAEPRISTGSVTASGTAPDLWLAGVAPAYSVHTSHA